MYSTRPGTARRWRLNRAGGYGNLSTMSRLQTLPLALSRRAHAVLDSPGLSREEERRLIAAVGRGDHGALSLIVATHMRAVRRIAWRYRRSGQPFGDLVQEGVVGLLEALKRFNPERDVRLSTYAAWWIRAAIQDHVVRTASLVRIGTTATQKTLFFRLLGRRRKPGDGEPVSADHARELAQRFNVSIAEVVQLARRMAGRDQSLDATPAPSRGSAPIERLVAATPTPEDAAAARQERRLLPRALALLPARERMIIERRFLAERKTTRDALGAELGVSKERIRQLEHRALGRLRRLMTRTASI